MGTAMHLNKNPSQWLLEQDAHSRCFRSSVIPGLASLPPTGREYPLLLGPATQTPALDRQDYDCLLVQCFKA